MKIGLVACAAQKLHRSTLAQFLYRSALFNKASAYCEREYDGWFILSALHGIVHPDDWIEPYDVTLNAMPRSERLAWGEMVRGQIRVRGIEAHMLYLHAGMRYREPFAGMSNTEAPLAGLGIGQQLRWYIERGIR